LHDEKIENKNLQKIIATPQNRVSHDAGKPKKKRANSQIALHHSMLAYENRIP
jgi:hypothetical protein